MNERLRLELLSARDGLDLARQWALATANLYQQAVDTPMHFASQPEWKPRFERVICELTVFSHTGILQEIDLTDERRADSDSKHAHVPAAGMAE